MESVPTMEPVNKPGIVTRFFTSGAQKYQSFLDRWVPFTTARWVFSFLVFILYFVRVFILQGWYIVTYALGIYLLNLFIAFLSPKIDPVFEQEDEDGPSLPTKSSEEFRPFIRRLPEFKFWYSATKAVLIAMFCTFFEVFNVPVFWPILVMYFFILFFLTMKRQIRHMIRYKYLPFSHGKTKYKGKEDSGEVIAQ
ncbi:protein RER1-like [Anneissia japonica]|uniref:protein RER1-like n=1 Tax=Anneissia japonica TaxID=1529436 RepID=UPI001425558F|nr:protein RER1-like [Anneissia japonica]